MHFLCRFIFSQKNKPKTPKPKTQNPKPKTQNPKPPNPKYQIRNPFPDSYRIRVRLRRKTSFKAKQERKAGEFLRLSKLPRKKRTISLRSPAAGSFLAAARPDIA